MDKGFEALSADDEGSGAHEAGRPRNGLVVEGVVRLAPREEDIPPVEVVVEAAAGAVVEAPDAVG